MRAANYVEMTTTSIAGTSGDGAVTCTAITSTPTFTLALGSGACTVRYVIEDTVNKKFETGIGSVASNVLTRTKPQVTWDGTTWADNAPSALQFGATPTSGNVKIRMAATADNTVNPMPQPQTTISGDSWRDYPFCAALATSTGNGTGAALTAAKEYYTAYKLDRSGTLLGFQYEVTTGVAGSIKAALYSCGNNGLPGDKIVDFVTTSCTAAAIKTDTATGSWTPTTPPRLTPGWYYIGIISDVGPSLRIGLGSISGIPTPVGRRDGYGYGRTLSIAGNYTTGLPAIPALTGGAMASNGAGFSCPWYGLKVTP